MMYRQLVRNYELHLKRERLLADRIRDNGEAEEDRNDTRLKEPSTGSTA
ncbi:MAG: hypothetical protein ACLS37_12170 [Alistipes sp.]